jgi:broad specificity phosphatase PhoE
MRYYLLRHAETDVSRAVDPHNQRLTPRGQEQAARLAECCREWGVSLLVSSMMLHSLQTADAVNALLPDLERWDLTDLEDLNLDDLMGDPTASHLVSTWTPEQAQIGLARLWVRVMAMLVRVQIYAAARQRESVAIVASERVLRLILLNWLDQDWTNYDEQQFEIAPGVACQVTVVDQQVELDWINCLDTRS